MVYAKLGRTLRAQLVHRLHSSDDTRYTCPPEDFSDNFRPTGNSVILVTTFMISYNCIYFIWLIYLYLRQE